MMRDGALDPPPRPKSAAEDFEFVLPCSRCQVRGHGVCSVVSRDDLSRLAALATIVDVAPGQTFVDEGAPAEHFHVVIAGTAKLYRLLPDGRCQILGFECAGGLLGLAAADGYAFSAEAITPVRMCRISRQKLRKVPRDCREMEQRLLDIAVGDLIKAQEQMLLLGRKTAVERVASFLLLQTACPQPFGIKPPRIHLPMSRVDIADHLGVTIETISRSLAKLREQDVIAVPNVHEIVVLDRPQLEAIANNTSRPHGSPATATVRFSRRLRPASPPDWRIPLAATDARSPHRGDL